MNKRGKNLLRGYKLEKLEKNISFSTKQKDRGNMKNNKRKKSKKIK